ncbi:hypothetical protein [Rothia sp. 88186D007BW]
MTDLKKAGRVIGIDLARCAALISMFIAQTAPSGGPGGVLNLSEFLAAPLFAFLLGAGALYSSQRMSFPALFASSVVRAIALIALGLYIGTWGAQVDIVLEYLGLLSLLMAPLVFLPSWVLIILAVGSWWFAASARTFFQPQAIQAAMEGSYTAYLYEWMFTGYNYQVFTLLAYACIGAVLAALIECWGVWGDVALALLGSLVTGGLFWYSRFAVAEFLPYTSSRLEIAFSLAACLATLGWCCLLARTLAGREHLAGALLGAGRMTLSLYVLQIAVLALYSNYAPTYGLPAADDSWAMMVGLILGALLFAWVWQRLLGYTVLGRGPLETPLAWVSGRS